MITVLKIGSLLVGACAALTITPISAAESPREHLSLDANWRFHLGDDWPDALRLDKAGVGGGAAAAGFAAEVTWRTVDLPHDWAVELPFDRAGDRNHGFKPLGPGFEEQQHRLVSPHVRIAGRRIRARGSG